MTTRIPPHHVERLRELLAYHRHAALMHAEAAHRAKNLGMVDVNNQSSRTHTRYANHIEELLNENS